MTAKEAAELLDLIAKKAPALRAAGVTQVNLAGVASFAVGETQQSPAAIAAEDEDLEDLPVLDDPVTYGRNPKRRNGARIS